MNAIVSWIISIVALTLMGVFATFFVVLNWIKLTERKDDDNGKTNREIVL